MWTPSVGMKRNSPRHLVNFSHKRHRAKMRINRQASIESIHSFNSFNYQTPQLTERNQLLSADSSERTGVTLVISWLSHWLVVMLPPSSTASSYVVGSVTSGIASVSWGLSSTAAAAVVVGEDVVVVSWGQTCGGSGIGIGTAKDPISITFVSTIRDSPLFLELLWCNKANIGMVDKSQLSQILFFTKLQNSTNNQNKLYIYGIYSQIQQCEQIRELNSNLEQVQVG